jgi:hypothetical protein
MNIKWIVIALTKKIMAERRVTERLVAATSQSHALELVLHADAKATGERCNN